MNKWFEPAREIPITAETDVLVVGGGPAGFSAALCAAREGAKVMLIEQSGDIGGVATTGLMSHWTGLTEGGIYEDILNRSACLRDAKHDRRIINPEQLKTVMLDMLDEVHVDLRLYTFACKAAMDGNRVAGIITESKSGREMLAAKITIDASGDGDIAASAGVPYEKGRTGDGKMQPMTLMFKVAGVDTERAVLPGAFEESFDVPEGDLQTLARQHLKGPAGHVLLYRSTLPGIITCNMTNCTDVDGTDVRDLTRATLVCRRQMDEIVTFLRRFVPGFEHCYVISSASQIGVRETRRFSGEKTITEKDILEARVFDDWAVTKANFNFDVHNVDGSGLDETGMQRLFPQKRGYTIPYGCFVPKGVDGLLLSGRNISGTHMAHSNYRVMPICANMGQATGIAASICVKKNIHPRGLDVTDLQSRLKELGVSP